MKTQPEYQKLANGKAVLTADFVCRIQPYIGAKIEIFVPRGFRWDGATIPCPARWLIGDPFTKEFIVPSLIHDWACENVNSTIARTISDAVFWELLNIYGVPRWKRFAMWSGVRLWSLFVWRPFRQW